MENNLRTQQEIEQEMLELNEQFTAFLHTKGIAAKFKLIPYIIELLRKSKKKLLPRLSDLLMN